MPMPEIVANRGGGTPSSSYRGRIAPSPTGYLHLGHARTFWTAYERAQARGGTLILRNEDLDPQRSRPEFSEVMIEDLRWLGIRWQEGPDVGGPHAPYLQSRRMEQYLEAWRQLRDGGWIYPCTCTRKELSAVAQAPHEEGEPIYPGRCRGRKGEGAASPSGVHWRFRVPDGEVVEFEDLGQGRQRFTAGTDFGDFVVWRRDNVPAYQLAVVVDDAAMKVTEVVRGADLLLSTARQLLLWRALGEHPPAWFHCDLVRDQKGERLAKRHDALSLRALRASGLTPEQVRQMWTGEADGTQQSTKPGEGGRQGSHRRNRP
jgi:glutamyl-tRNA synthetase